MALLTAARFLHLFSADVSTIDDYSNRMIRSSAVAERPRDALCLSKLSNAMNKSSAIVYYNINQLDAGM